MELFAIRSPACSLPINVFKPQKLFASFKLQTFSVCASRRNESPSTSAVLKPACLTLAAAAATTAAALLLGRPALASAPPVVQSEPVQSESDEERVLNSRLASNPADVDALRSLMELKVKTRKLNEAIAVVDKLIVLDPADRDLSLLKSHLQSYSGDSEPARKGFEALLEADPLVVEAYHGLVLLASRSDSPSEDLQSILSRVSNAVKICENDNNRRDESRDFKLLMAQIKVIEGKYEEALRIYQELVRDEPRDFRPYLCQGIIYTLMRKKDEAEKQFEKYQRLVPKGHPYARYFEENMAAMNAFSQVATSERGGSKMKN